MRGVNRWVYMSDERVRRGPQENGSGQFGSSGRGLNSEAALTGKPEEIRPPRSVAVNGPSVGRETSKSRPAMFDPLHLPIHHLFQPVNRKGDVLLFGGAVARIARRLIVRADPEAPVSGLK